jgi:hypothetical protein
LEPVLRCASQCLNERHADTRESSEPRNGPIPLSCTNGRDRKGPCRRHAPLSANERLPFSLYLDTAAGQWPYPQRPDGKLWIRACPQAVRRLQQVFRSRRTRTAIHASIVLKACLPRDPVARERRRIR